ncbi:SMC-Scp complex subunit ScpB [Xaviernesmea oryzae]|uniref:SMC-Scp complex subunit ScpB n=1 Tax=Xaviernesmea oryzae TaxID=464029 RepID=A0A1Q9AX41_9HYPH|nr:SMC-Scp complex subunit ScpB [Xaviernesmea oryzae]OLP59998.1 SMC-Scp complex subunit ScpB [Xaviernesmea oryzae]SEK41079.1 segregation and condensation protein B [Xaviernesmea oryzae]
MSAEQLKVSRPRLVAPDPAVEAEAERVAEALVFAAAAPVSLAYIAERLPDGVDAQAVMARLKLAYRDRGVNLVESGQSFAFRTAADLARFVADGQAEPRRLSRAALEVLAIIAYHQPVTRAEIEDVRGVQTSKGTLDVLMEAGWVRFRGRRRTPGRPVTFGTTRDFLDHFGLEDLRDLPAVEDLKAAGLITGKISSGLSLPIPADSDTLGPDEDPITPDDIEALGILAPGVGEDETA